ncbi:MAG: hypothetical protein KGJ90_00150 [Patescibacteria group bacterium]|nr:hypothetical protein [Patescibacteria group bacterium]
MPPSRKSNISRYNRFFYKILNQEWCVYCGDLATTVDHFIPISIFASLIGIGADINGKILVPACRECNLLAGDKLFKTIGAKRRYLQNRIKERYRKVLNMPFWEEKEISELSPHMQEIVKNGLLEREHVKARIGWKNINNRESAKLAAVCFSSRVRGGNSVPTNAPKKRKGKDISKRSQNYENYHADERLISVPCLCCGNPFIKNRPWARYCSKICRQKVYWKNLMAKCRNRSMPSRDQGDESAQQD